MKIKINIFFVVLISLFGTLNYTNAGGGRYATPEYTHLIELKNPYKEHISLPILLKLSNLKPKLEKFSDAQLRILGTKLDGYKSKYKNNKTIEHIIMYLQYDVDSILSDRDKNLSLKDACILDVCIKAEKGDEIINEDDKIKILYGGNKNKDFAFPEGKLIGEYYTNKSYIYKTETLGMGSRTFHVKKLGSYYIKQIIETSCAGGTIKQEELSLYGEIMNSEIFGLPREIKVGNYSWKLTYNFKEASARFYQRETIVLPESINHTDKLEQYMKENIFNKDISKREIFRKYIIKIPNGAYAMYEADFEQPERIVYLGNDQEWLNKNISYNGDLNNLSITNKIVNYYGENSSRGLVDDEGGRKIDITSADLPIFKAKKFSNNGYYFLYPTRGYEIASFAEMCKPAVYVYNTKKIENNLQIDSGKSSYFTKLIPEFNEDNSWNFSSKNGKIEVDDTEFGYLYYAIKVKNYKHNNDGWIVSGANIEKFFNDKLDKINFNSQEKKDFLEYWIPRYSLNKYYFVSFKYKKELDELVQLNFKKAPDNEFRVLLDSFELDSLEENHKKYLYSTVGDKFDEYLIQKFDRDNSEYEVFEWGGVLEKEGKYIVY